MENRPALVRYFCQCHIATDSSGIAHGSDIQNTPKFFDLMYEHNYVIFHKEPNIAYPGAIEYAFLKLAPEFSKDIVRAKGAVPGE